MMASNHAPPPTGLDPYRFPPDPWRLVERQYDPSDMGTTETLFAVANGYLGMRANPEEGRDAHSHGTYINGFHETWEILHAENAFGFAKVGQTIANAPDAKLIKLYVDDEPLLLGKADLPEYERSIDFRTGILTRDLLFNTPAGKQLRVRSTRMVSVHDRHLGVMTFEITMVDGEAPVTVSSQILNRQDGEDEYHVPDAALGEGPTIPDPRRASTFDHRVLVPEDQREDDGFAAVGYRCAGSGMTIAVAQRHLINGTDPWSVSTSVEPDHAKTVFEFELRPGDSVHITKLVSYHTSTGVPSAELIDRCERTLNRAVDAGLDTIVDQQRQRWADFWADSDVRVTLDDAAFPEPDRQAALQQAIRWNLFQLGQATLAANELGVPAKAVTAGGYDGHYFWDSEIYVLPFLAFTNPSAARKLLRFRWRLLDAARRRAAQMNERGALYTWRTINGEEASAYYAAGTAQYHINAAIVWALAKYLDASGDVEFLASEGAEMLVETARLWESLGFFATRPKNGSAGTFHIHRVTGPDEYTTVVNDNCYTNLMARFNLRYAARTVRFLSEWNPEAFEELCRRTELDLAELDVWDAAADAMYIPYDNELMVHPQHASFMDLEPWDWDGTPRDKYPLLLHFHPLVIYRHQVLKQTDVVLAMYLRRQHFTVEQKRRNFDFYDPITTGDSSLSACVQAIVAAEVGHHDLAMDYFTRALLLDLCDSHNNTVDGVHIASCGGVWAGLVHGFVGLTDSGEALSFAPQLPRGWAAIECRLHRHGSSVDVVADPDGVTLRLADGVGVPVDLADGRRVAVTANAPLRIEDSPLLAER